MVFRGFRISIVICIIDGNLKADFVVNIKCIHTIYQLIQSKLGHIKLIVRLSSFIFAY